MLDNILVCRGTAIESEVDFGGLAECLLFYGHTEIVLSGGQF